MSPAAGPLPAGNTDARPGANPAFRILPAARAPRRPGSAAPPPCHIWARPEARASRRWLAASPRGAGRYVTSPARPRAAPRQPNSKHGHAQARRGGAGRGARRGRGRAVLAVRAARGRAGAGPTREPRADLRYRQRPPRRGPGARSPQAGWAVGGVCTGACRDCGCRQHRDPQHPPVPGCCCAGQPAFNLHKRVSGSSRCFTPLLSVIPNNDSTVPCVVLQLHL